MKDKKDSETDAGKSGGIIPAELFAEIGHRENCEDRARDDFLNRFELGGGEFVRADAIGRHLEAVFEKGDASTGEDNLPERFAAIFQMAVPCERHEDVGNCQQQDGAHEVFGS